MKRPTLQERIERIRRIIETDPPRKLKPPAPAQLPAKKRAVGAREMQARRDREERMKKRDAP